MRPEPKTIEHSSHSLPRLLDWTTGLMSLFVLLAWWSPLRGAIASSGLFVCLQLVCLWLAFVSARRHPRLANVWVALQLAMLVGWVWDAIEYRWTGHRLLSEFTMTLLTEHVQPLWQFRSAGMFRSVLGTLGVTFAGAGVAWWMSGRIQKGVANSSCRVLVSWLALIVASVFGLLSSGSVKNAEPNKRSSSRELLAIDQLDAAIERRMNQFRFNVISEQPPRGELPNVVIVIVESWRPELLTPDVMPNVDSLARRGLRLGNHWSGGNGTSLGVFSLLSGMEAIWFYKSEVRYAPTLNRLFHQAGYEIGFFAGQQDWDSFQMGETISPNHFDRIHEIPGKWLDSDRQVIQAAHAYLSPSARSSPRLAIVYLNSTHAPFDVDPAMAVDQPAATVNYPIPFSMQQREQVWNRYRNAARSLDHALLPLLREDRVIAIVGDHGEAFLEDGTIGHGTQLSAVQLRTPFVLAGAHVPSGWSERLSTHADILPTLCSACGLKLSMPDVLDGMDLLAERPSVGTARVVSVADYVAKRILLLRSDRSGDGVPLGWRCDCSWIQGSFSVVDAVDDYGKPVPWQGDSDCEQANLDAQTWLLNQQIIDSRRPND